MPGGANSSSGLQDILLQLRQLGVPCMQFKGWRGRPFLSFLFEPWSTSPESHCCVSPPWLVVIRCNSCRGAEKQDSKQIAAAIRAAVPKLTLRSHVLAEAAKLVEIQQPGEWGTRKSHHHITTITMCARGRPWPDISHK